MNVSVFKAQQPAAQAPATSEPVADFEGQVKALIAAGMSESKAVRKVAVGNPELHRSYLIAANRRGGHKRAARRLEAQPVARPMTREQRVRRVAQHERTTDNPLGQYHQLVDFLVANKNMSEAEAKSWIAHNRPDMTKAMVNVTNALHGRPGRLD